MSIEHFYNYIMARTLTRWW